ncbi:MAG: hypothetical protein IJC95_01680 [Clostridia bacterium]|nr:hypothetical protein [Clostridia bacterium]
MYEKLLDEAEKNGLTVIEKYPFISPRIRGLCCDDTIAISAQIDTEAERTVVLCEELTHALHSYGDILTDARMERRTREHIFDRLIGIDKLLDAALEGCREPWEFAEHFGVPEEFFVAAMQNYRERYGTMTKLSTEKGEFILSFEPTFRVRRLFSSRNKKRMIRKDNAT